METLHTLLSKRWILKKKDPETYYSIKDNYYKYKDFLKNKLGYNLIINPLLIKLEKLPGLSQSFMGIAEMKTTQDYVFLCLLLMFLEELDIGEQFVLSQGVDYVKNQYPGESVIDWTIYGNRKSLIYVLRFCLDEGLILLNDGSDSAFSKSETAMEILYENTGASKYFMRRFPFDINEIGSYKDFENMEWQSNDVDRGLIRRQRVYRRLVMEPVVYHKGSEDQDYLYIKNMRSVIANDIEKFLGSDFHLHKNGAMVLLKEPMGEVLPNRRNLSDIVIQLCTLVQRIGIVDKSKDTTLISDTKWEMLIHELIEKYSSGWGKTYRELPVSKLLKEINELMTAFGMIEVDHREVTLLPMIGKLCGDYPKSFWEKINGEMED